VVGKLDGMFSFVLVDLRDKSFIAARDPLGITPLYLGWGNDGLLQLPPCLHLMSISGSSICLKSFS
jgi:asparagine synthetase B (glutamine-hydrolysing)